jgi:hypothetical protein
MTSTEHSILVDISLVGYSVILTHKAREFKAASTLIALRIIHIEAGNDKMWIVKFGQAPIGFQPREI